MNALQFPLIPERASEIAGSVDALFYSLLILCGLIICGIFLAVTYFCIRYRRGSPASRVSTPGTPLRLEIGWTSVTLVVFMGIFVWAADIYFQMAEPPPNAVEIHVVGKQWMWKIQHANGRREINELHLLLGQPAKLVMTSQDVIHDFSVPAFRTKQDVVPGRYTQEWFTPTKPGRYHLFCVAYCGTDHSRMGGWVHVLEPQAYAKWLSNSKADETMIASGANLFRARGCSGCHSPQSAVHAPPLEGIYNKPVPLSDGTIVIADEQYIHDSILLASKQIVAGYQNLMPTYQGQLTEEEVMQLITYIKAMRNPEGETP